MNLTFAKTMSNRMQRNNWIMIYVQCMELL